MTHRSVPPAPYRRPDDAFAAARLSAPWLVCAFGAVAAVVAWARLTPTTRGTLWAEDGRVFLQDAVHAPAFSTVLRPYDGYLHVVPRFVASVVAAAVPAAWWAVTICALACAIAGAVAAGVLVLSRTSGLAPAARLVAATATVLAPALPLEVLGNLANLHWFFLWLAPWLVLHVPSRRRSVWPLALLALVVALSEVQALYVVPLLLVRRRERRLWPIRGALLLGLVAQAVAVLTTTRSAPVGALPEPAAVVVGYLVNACMTVWVGGPGAITRLVSWAGWGVTALFGLPLVLAVVTTWRGSPRRRWLVLGGLVASGLVWTVAFVLNRPPLFDTQGARCPCPCCGTPRCRRWRS